uniref:B-1,4-glucanase n=1 Tax=Tanacetum cinerariifolium TaxID=118510 RepID=A0A699HYH8_TANCI|nr:b-1,4-glucanase [Tanacetum cinerariifolium]
MQFKGSKERSSAGVSLRTHWLTTAWLSTWDVRDLAREAVRKTLVLLKNAKYSQPLLPLPKKTSKILVAGSHADNIGYRCGG